MRILCILHKSLLLSHSNYLPSLERRIWKLVLRALPSFCFEFATSKTFYIKFVRSATHKTCLKLKLADRIISKQNICLCVFREIACLLGIFCLNLGWDMVIYVYMFLYSAKCQNMARNAGQHGGFLCLSKALIQHSKWRIYIEYA